MKKNVISIEKVRESLTEYINKPLVIRVNKGRNKIYYYDCKIINLFPSVFQIETVENETQTYSYSGILCGEVKLKMKEQVQ